MSHADYVVLRPSPDMPAEWMPPELDGKWYDIDQVPVGHNHVDVPGPTPGRAYGVPTGRFEVRESDGAVAEVWEVRTWPNR